MEDRRAIELRKQLLYPNAIGGFGLGWNATKPEIIEEIIGLAASGATAASIARRTGASISTVRRVLRGHRPKRKEREDA